MRHRQCAKPKVIHSARLYPAHVHKNPSATASKAQLFPETDEKCDVSTTVDDQADQYRHDIISTPATLYRKVIQLGFQSC